MNQAGIHLNRCHSISILITSILTVTMFTQVRAQDRVREPEAPRFVVLLDHAHFDGEPPTGFDPCACGRDGAALFLTQAEIDALTVPHRVISRLDEYMRRFKPGKTMAAVGVPSISRLLGEPVPDVWPLPGGSTAGALSLTYDRYHTPQEGIDFYHALAAAYPHIVRIQSIGMSVEGRDLWALKISDHPDLDEEGEPNILFCGLHHAREWVTHEMMLYLAEKLVTGYDADLRIRRIVDQSAVWLVLSVNPDGFEYTWTNDRMWRKNRRFNGQIFGFPVYGVDINRNYSYLWGPGYNGSSGNPLSETYRGPSAASEPETQAMQALLAETKPVIAVSYHTFSQLVLYPWGYTQAAIVQSYASHRAISEKYAGLVLRTHGMNYIPGPVNFTLYPTNGDFTDYAYAVHGVIAYTPEMRPASSQLGGFVLPEDQLLMNCQENYEAALWMLDNVADARRVFVPDSETFEPGANFFSLPLTPLNQKPEWALGMDGLTASYISGWLNDAAHPQPGFFAYPSSGMEGVGSMSGYRFMHAPESAPWADGFTSYMGLPYVFDDGASTLIGNVTIPGKNYVGVPFEHPIRLRDVEIVKRVIQEVGNTFGLQEVALERRTALEDLASPTPWMDWRWTHTAPDGEVRTSHPTGDAGADELIHPFRAYEFQVNMLSYQFGSETVPAYIMRFPEPVRTDGVPNGVVDLEDHFVLTGCLTGPVSAMLNECDVFDFDHDLDIDLDDFRLLQRQFGRMVP